VAVSNVELFAVYCRSKSIQLDIGSIFIGTCFPIDLFLAGSMLLRILVPAESACVSS